MIFRYSGCQGGGWILNSHPPPVRIQFGTIFVKANFAIHFKILMGIEVLVLIMVDGVVPSYQTKPPEDNK